MKKVLLLSMFILVTFSSCDRFSNESDYEIEKICEILKLSVMTVQMDNVYIKEVKERNGKTAEIVIKLPLDCKFSYDLNNITVENNVLTLPSCKVSVSLNTERETKYYNGGDARITIVERNRYLREIKKSVVEKDLEESRYKDKAFNHAKELLTKLLGDSIKVRPNDNPLDIEDWDIDSLSACKNLSFSNKERRVQ